MSKTSGVTTRNAGRAPVNLEAAYQEHIEPADLPGLILAGQSKVATESMAAAAEQPSATHDQQTTTSPTSIEPPEVEVYHDPIQEAQVTSHLYPSTDSAHDTVMVVDEWNPKILEKLSNILENPNHTSNDLAIVMHDQQLLSQSKGLPLPDLPRSYLEQRDMSELIDLICAGDFLARADPDFSWQDLQQLTQTYDGNGQSTSSIPRIRGVEVAPLAGMRTIEGTAILRQWTNSEQTDLRKYRVPVRIALAPEQADEHHLNSLFATSVDGRTDETNMNVLVRSILGGMTDNVDSDIIGEIGSHDPDRQIVNTLIEAMQTHPDVPITLINAHGGNGGIFGRSQYIQTGSDPDNLTDLSTIIGQIRSRDSALGRDTSTVVLCSCNAAGLRLQYSDVTLMYRTGIAGGTAEERTGRLTFASPLEKPNRPFQIRGNHEVR